MMQENKRAGVLLFLVVAAHLLAATAGAYSGQVVISDAGATMSTKRLENMVAPELSWAAGLLGGGIGESALDKDKQACLKNKNCAAPCDGCSYTRPCTYEEKCRH
uniref:Uncharacterized protein n=1 Tax=Avena sativa TaxID=4498 RepID=A0ACD5XYG6_AVESA